VHLDSPHSRHQVGLEELIVVVTDIAAADEKIKEDKERRRNERGEGNR